MCVVRTMIYTDHTYIHVLYLIAPSFYSDGNVGRRYCCGIATCNCAGALMKVLHAAQLPLNEIPPHHRPLICTATRSMHWLLHSRMQLIQRLHTGWWTRPIYIYIPQDDRYILIDLQLLHHRMEQEEPKNCCWWQHAPSWLFQMDMCTLLLLISSIQFEQECILFWKEQVERICCFGKEQELAHTRVERIIYIASMDELISIQIS